MMFDVSMARMLLGRKISGDDQYLDRLERYVDTLEAGREILVNSRNLLLTKVAALKAENEKLVAMNANLQMALDTAHQRADDAVEILQWGKYDARLRGCAVAGGAGA